MQTMLLSNGTDGLKAISDHLKTLGFADTPDYDTLRSHLTSMPDGFPPRKHPPTNPNPAQPFTYPQHSSPSLVAAPQPEVQAPHAAGVHYPPAHPSNGLPAVQYPEAAWPPPEQQYMYGYGGEGVQAAAWQGYDQNGYGSSAACAWEPQPASAYQHNWYPPDHVSPHTELVLSVTALPKQPGARSQCFILCLFYSWHA